MSQKLKRAVIKEELVALTGDYVDAILLNQFIYWSERVVDFDKFIREELDRANEQGEAINLELREGWIYKKAEELAEETMLGLSKSNMLKHIKALVESGWVDQRRNPKNKMDKTYQYRVNIVKIQRDLYDKGYGLEGYRIPGELLVKPRSSETELRSSKTELRSNETELRVTETELRGSEIEQQYQRLHTETTSENIINNYKGVVADFGINEATVTTESLTDGNEELISVIESHLGTSVSSLYPQIAIWLEQYGPDLLIEKARIVGMKKNLRSVIGAYCASVQDNWTELPSNAIPTRKEEQRDERYSAFYELFPDA